MARGAAARGRKIAFGDGRKLIWGPYSELAFRHNPNIARSVNEPGLEWSHYHKGSRQYNKLGNGRWIWNYDFKARPGEFFFDDHERAHIVRRSVLIEPNVPWHKSVAPNKDWGFSKFQELADRLRVHGLEVYQTDHGVKRLHDVQWVHVSDFRYAAAVVAGFDLVICPEGGLHHAAAAVSTPAIVLFGGFIPPQVTGYDTHINLTGGADACGSLRECPHCRDAMRRIGVDEVFDHAMRVISHAGRS